MGLPEDMQSPIAPPSLIRAHEELLAVHGGRALVGAFHQHQREVMRLVNTNRRVATVWHRSGGPRIFQSFLQAAQAPDRAAPSELDGCPVRSSLERIRHIFLKYGSDRLRSDICAWTQALLRAPGLTYAQFIAELRDFEPRYAG